MREKCVPRDTQADSDNLHLLHVAFHVASGDEAQKDWGAQPADVPKTVYLCPSWGAQVVHIYLSC